MKKIILGALFACVSSTAFASGYQAVSDAQRSNTVFAIEQALSASSMECDRMSFSDMNYDYISPKLSDSSAKIYLNTDGQPLVLVDNTTSSTSNGLTTRNGVELTFTTNPDQSKITRIDVKTYRQNIESKNFGNISNPNIQQFVNDDSVVSTCTQK